MQRTTQWLPLTRPFGLRSTSHAAWRLCPLAAPRSRLRDFHIQPAASGVDSVARLPYPSGYGPCHGVPVRSIVASARCSWVSLDVMPPGEKEPAWVIVLASVMFFYLGACLIAAGRYAAFTGSIIPHSYRMGSMSSLHAYVAGGLNVAFGLCAILSVVLRRKPK